MGKANVHFSLHFCLLHPVKGTNATLCVYWGDGEENVSSFKGKIWGSEAAVGGASEDQRTQRCLLTGRGPSFTPGCPFTNTVIWRVLDWFRSQTDLGWLTCCVVWFFKILPFRVTLLFFKCPSSPGKDCQLISCCWLKSPPWGVSVQFSSVA